MDFVLIYGPPGVGKLTVATELSRLTGYRLFDNHVSIDWAKEYFAFDTPGFLRLMRTFREAVIEEAAREGLDLIYTYVYAHDEDLPDLTARFGSVDKYGGRVCLVQLMCDQALLESRVGQQSRLARGKLTTVDKLRQWQQRYDMSTPVPGRESLRIDNSELIAADVASRIVGHFGLRLAGAGSN